MVGLHVRNPKFQSSLILPENKDFVNRNGIWQVCQVLPVFMLYLAKKIIHWKTKKLSYPQLVHNIKVKGLKYGIFGQKNGQRTHACGPLKVLLLTKRRARGNPRQPSCEVLPKTFLRRLRRRAGASIPAPSRKTTYRPGSRFYQNRS